MNVYAAATFLAGIVIGIPLGAILRAPRPEPRHANEEKPFPLDISGLDARDGIRVDRMPIDGEI